MSAARAAPGERHDVDAAPLPVRGSGKRRIILLAGLAALLPLVAFALYAMLASLDAYRASNEARLRDTARALAAAVDAQLESYVVAVRVLATSRLLGSDFDAAAFAARSRDVGEALDGWVALLGPPPAYPILSLSTQADQSNLPSELPPDRRQLLAPVLAQVFQHGRAGISDLFEGSVIQRQILTAMVPVTRLDMPPRALALSFEPSDLRELLARQDLPRGTFAAVADGRLRILAHSLDPDGERVGVAAPDWVGDAIKGRQRALVVGPGWNGQGTVYAVERLRLAPGWTVTVAEPLAAQQASAWHALRWLLAGGAALGLGLAVVVWASRREAVRDAWREAEAIRAGRNEVERLLRRLPAVIFLYEIAPNGVSRLVYRGGDIATVTGWPPTEILSRGMLDDLVHPDDPTLAQKTGDLLREGDVGYDWRMRKPGGGWRRLHTLARVLDRRPDGSAEIVGYMVDVDARREAEARANAAARLASLGEMAGSLAHELKQPLQTISLAAEIAQIAAERGEADTMHRRLDSIVQQTRRTAEMIDRLRRFARGGQDGAEPQPVSVAVAVEGALALAHAALRDASITVDVSLGDPPPVVRGEPVLLEQVLSNLLLNARDVLSARPAGAPRRIVIAATPQPGGMVRLTVADTGGVNRAGFAGGSTC